MRDLAEIVRETFAGCEIEYAEGAGPDPRSYRVDFGKLAETLPDARPSVERPETALESCSMRFDSRLGSDVPTGFDKYTRLVAPQAPGCRRIARRRPALVVHVAASRRRARALAAERCAEADPVKVVLFCGGLGLRMQEAAPSIPKPMVPIANRPILSHIMKYYAHFGHDDFIICLGHKGEVIKDYFLNYNEALANDFVLSGGGRDVELLASDIGEWRITFVNTGLHSNIGQRLRAVQKHLAGEELFLATYGDAVTDAPLPQPARELPRAQQDRRVPVCEAEELLVPHGRPFGRAARSRDRGRHAVRASGSTEGSSSSGREIFDYIEEGEELVEEPFGRLIEREQLIAYPYEGFWAPMDTLKDKHNLETLAASGRPPWEVWAEPTGADQRRAPPGHAEAELGEPRPPSGILAIGCHADDIEIGCGGTILHLIESLPRRRGLLGRPQRRTASVPTRFTAARMHFSRGPSSRAGHRRATSATASSRTTEATIKDFFEDLKPQISPDLIFTHYRNDLHQDHRLASELTWNTFRNHLILEYEVPKYDGDFGSPNVFFHLERVGLEPEGRESAHVLPDATRAALVHGGSVPFRPPPSRHGVQLADAALRGRRFYGRQGRPREHAS